MRPAVRVITPPAPSEIDKLLPIADLRRHCVVGATTDFDADLARFANTAFQWVHTPGGWLGRSLLLQRLRLDFPCWPDSPVQLPCGPIGENAVASVVYFDVGTNAQQTLSTDQWFQDEDAVVWSERFIRPALYARPGAVRITYDAGYVTAADVPEPIRQGLLMCISHWMENREAVAAAGELALIPLGAMDVLGTYRLW